MPWILAGVVLGFIWVRCVNELSVCCYVLTVVWGCFIRGNAGVCLLGTCSLGCVDLLQVLCWAL